MFTSVATGERVRTVWPRGTGVRDTGNGFELVAPNARVFAREGDVIDDAGGGVGPDGRFHVCSIGATTFLPAASPAPSDSTALELRTAKPVDLPPGAVEACQGGAFPPVRMGREGRTVVFSRVEGGARSEIVWPWGFSARLERGGAELVDSYGIVIAREGDVLADLGGGATEDGPHVCSIGHRTYSSVRGGG